MMLCWLVALAQAELEEMVREADSQFRSDLGDGSIQIEEFRALLKAQ